MGLLRVRNNPELRTSPMTLAISPGRNSEIPRGFSHALILSEGKVVDAGLLTDVLNAENLSKAFGQSIALEVIDGRYFARRTRSRAAHRRR